MRDLSAFDDLFAANREFAATFDEGHLPAEPPAGWPS